MHTVSFRFLPIKVVKKSLLVNGVFLVNQLIAQKKSLCSLTSENDSVTLENFEFVHLSLSHLDDRVVVLLRVLHLQLMGRLFAVHNRSRIVLFRSIAFHTQQIEVDQTGL